MSTLSPFREDAAPAAPTASQHEDETWYSPEIVGSAPLVSEYEEEAATEEADEAFDFGEAEAETSHPILALFPLPPAVLEALSNGLSSVAVGLAANAGYRDTNQLTNIVFYFRHPNLIGRKIRPDERDLAAEWVAIRDRLVKPALRSTVSVPPTPTPAPAPAAAPGTYPAALSPDGLQWPGHSQAELEFMKAVYLRHRQRARGDFVMDLPKDSLAQVEGEARGREARKDAAAAVKKMLDDARIALAREHPEAQIGIVSAYRSATRQFEIWQGHDPQGKDKGSGFPYYYGEAKSLGLVREGDFSPAAVEKVAEYLGGYIASPGFSNHQDGLAFDFGVGLKGKGLGKLREGSWFHKWLKLHAPGHRFEPLKTEAWHWTYRPKPGGAQEVWAGEVATEVGAPVRANEVRVPRIPLLKRHSGRPPDLILRWNDMPSVPAEIDVAVHLHGFWYDRMSLVRDIEPVSGLDLVPVKGEQGQGRTRPTLTVLPRGNNTGIKQTQGPYNAYTFPALVTKTGLTDLIQVALERFASEVGGSAPRVGRLILTAHSGGGKALLQILQYHDPHQVHVFDALYWSPDPLIAWARKRIEKDRAAGASADYMAKDGGGLRVFYQGRYAGGTRPSSLAVRKALAGDIDPSVAAWYRVEASKYDHFQIPRLYGWRVLADVAADVPQAYVEQPKARREAELEREDEYEDAGEYEDEGEHEYEYGDEHEYEYGGEHDHEDLFGEAELWEAEDEDEGIESPEVERGEAEAFLGELEEEELPFERVEETPTTVTFPSGVALTVVTGPTGQGEEHYDPNSTGNPLLDTGPAVRGQRVSANFTVGELVHSGGKTFDRARIDPELVRCLQKLRDHVGKPVRVTSGYRPYLYNVDLYTKTYNKKPTLSRHSSGQAADVNVSGMTGMQLAKAAIDAYGTEIGVGVGNGFAHIDVRRKWARWTYFESDKQRNDQAIAELDAYRRQRPSGGTPVPAPKPTPAPAPAPTPAAPDEAAIRVQWDAHPKVHNHFDGGYKTYRDLAPLYRRQHGINDAGAYIEANIVEVQFLGRRSPGHRDLVAPLRAAEDELRRRGPLPKIKSFWSFVPRRIEGTNKLSNHARGRAIDIDPATNPMIKHRDDILVIRTATGVDFGAPQNAATLRAASNAFRSTFSEDWIRSQSADVAAAAGRRRRELAGYARFGLFTLDQAIVDALVSAGLRWGGSFPTRKDSMHFELRT